MVPSGVVERNPIPDRWLRTWLHELDSVAERIGHVDAVVAFEGLVLFHGEPGRCDDPCDAADLVDDEGGMSFRCWAKVRLDTEVDFQIAIFEPAASTDCEVSGFGHVSDAEYPFVESDGIGFTACWHRQLDVVKTDDSHGVSLPQRGVGPARPRLRAVPVDLHPRKPVLQRTAGSQSAKESGWHRKVGDVMACCGGMPR